MKLINLTAFLPIVRSRPTLKAGLVIASWTLLFPMQAFSVNASQSAAQSAAFQAQLQSIQDNLNAVNKSTNDSRTQLNGCMVNVTGDPSTVPPAPGPAPAPTMPPGNWSYSQLAQGYTWISTDLLEVTRLATLRQQEVAANLRTCTKAKAALDKQKSDAAIAAANEAERVKAEAALTATKAAAATQAAADLAHQREIEDAAALALAQAELKAAQAKLADAQATEAMKTTALQSSGTTGNSTSPGLQTADEVYSGTDSSGKVDVTRAY